MAYRTFALASLALWMGCTPLKRAERASVDDPWSQANLREAMATVIPLVEEAAGREFLREPKVAVAHEDSFQKLLYAEQLRIYEQVMADTPEPIRRQLAEAAGQFMSSGILGKYILETETVYLCPEAILPSMEHSEIPADRVEEVILVVLAHELVHALEDQHTDLERQLDLLRDEEDLWAAAGVWEGWATLVEERVSEKLGYTDIFLDLIALQGWSPEGLQDPDAWRTWAIYGQGRNFVMWHDDQGGVEQVWRTLEHPPAHTGMLFRPETYAPVSDPSPVDYAAVLRGVEQHLAEGDWMVTNSRLGEFDLRKEAATAGNEDALDEILGHLSFAHKLDLGRPDRSGSVRLLVFEDETWPRAFLDLLRTQETHASADTSSVLDLAVEVRYELFDEVEADDAVLRVERIPLGAGEYRENHSAWVVRDDVMILVEADRFAPGERLGRVVQTILDRLDDQPQSAL